MAADKAEETTKLREELEQRHQAEIAKQESAVNETSNCQSTDSFLTTSHSFVYNQEEVVRNTSTQNILNTEESLKPEQVEDAFQLLSMCDSIEELAALRQHSEDITPVAFKAASKRLEPSKRQQIKEWVLTLNAANDI